GRRTRTFPDLVDHARFHRAEAQRWIGGRLGLATHGLVGVVGTPPSLLDHAVHDAVDRVARGEGSLIDVLKLGGIEAALTQLLLGNVVAPTRREAPAIPVDRRGDGQDAVELGAEALGHLMAFAAAVRAAHEVVSIVRAPVVSARDDLAP